MGLRGQGKYGINSLRPRDEYICVIKLTIIGSDNAILWTNAGLLLIGSLGTNFCEILIHEKAAWNEIGYD